MPKNMWSVYKNRSTNQKIALAGVFLALVILFQYFERFVPFANTFLKLNFSLLFVLPIFYFAGPWYGLLTLIIRFIVGTSNSDVGSWTNLAIVGNLILLISSVVAILFLYFFSIIFNRIESHNKNVIIISILTIISSSLILTILNALFFTPTYFWVFDSNSISGPFDVDGIIDIYQNQVWVRAFHFYIPNYWLGIFTVYFTGNVIKFSSIFIAYFSFSKVIRLYLL